MQLSAGTLLQGGKYKIEKNWGYYWEYMSLIK